MEIINLILPHYFQNQFIIFYQFRFPKFSFEWKKKFLKLKNAKFLEVPEIATFGVKFLSTHKYKSEQRPIKLVNFMRNLSHISHWRTFFLDLKINNFFTFWRRQIYLRHTSWMSIEEAITWRAGKWFDIYSIVWLSSINYKDDACRLRLLD